MFSSLFVITRQQREMFNRTLTDERFMYDETKRFVDSNNTVRKI